MVWVLISASFSTFTYMSAEMPIPASPLSLQPFVSSVFLVHHAHPALKRLLSLFFSLPVSFCVSSFPYCALFSWVIAAYTLILLWLFPAKNKHDVVAGPESSRTGHMKPVRTFMSLSPSSNIHWCHQCAGSNYPGAVRSEICPLFPQVVL